MYRIIDNTIIQFAEAIKTFFISTNGNRVRVLGSSMSPSIKNNQEVFISYSNIILKPGYCYAFLYGNNTVVHRFVRIKNGMAVFIGDRSRSIEIVYPNCVVGYVPLQQNIFIIQTIAFINYVFIKLFFYIKIVKLLRIACIMMLTKGAPHARKI